MGALQWVRLVWGMRMRRRAARHPGGRALVIKYVISTAWRRGDRSTEDQHGRAPLPVFFHQCEVPFFYGAKSPACGTIGTAAAARVLDTSQETM